LLKRDRKKLRWLQNEIFEIRRAPSEDKMKYLHLDGSLPAVNISFCNQMEPF
jgi:hypothetical protein